MIQRAISGFWMGFGAPLKALRLIAVSPRMLTLVAIPLALNILLYIAFFSYGANYLDEQIAALLAAMSAKLPAWLIRLSGWILKLLAWLFLGLVAALAFTFVSGLLAAPFNDSLSRAALRARLLAIGLPAPAPTTSGGLAETIWLEAKRMGVLIVGAMVALVLALIPFLQLPALALGAMVVSFEYFGYPIAQRSTSLTPVYGFTLRHPAVSLGFGSFLLLIMALPFTSIFYIPMAVVGGTILYADLAIKAKQLPAEMEKPFSH